MKSLQELDQEISLLRAEVRALLIKLRAAEDARREALWVPKRSERAASWEFKLWHGERWSVASAAARLNVAERNIEMARKSFAGMTFVAIAAEHRLHASVVSDIVSRVRRRIRDTDVWERHWPGKGKPDAVYRAAFSRALKELEGGWSWLPAKPLPRGLTA